MEMSHVNASEVAILSRVLEPDKPTLSAHAARDNLAFDFTQADKDRMRQLSAKAREGTLTADEQCEINNYKRVGHLLNLMQSKARCSLKGGRGTNGKTRSRRRRLRNLPPEPIMRSRLPHRWPTADA
jgi:hypothetical protein